MDKIHIQSILFSSIMSRYASIQPIVDMQTHITVF
jgi:hypothetical protein